MKRVLSLFIVFVVSVMFVLPGNVLANSGKISKMLDSGSVDVRIKAAKMVARDKAFEPGIMKKIETKLKAGYNKKTSDRMHNDEMAFYCKALGASGDLKYKKLLQKVTNGTKNRNLKRHAGNSLKLLADNAELNKLTSSKKGWDSSLSDQENKQLQMLRAKQFNLKKTAARQIYNNPGANTKIYDEIAKQLLAGSKKNSRDKDYVDTMAWLCKALGSSGKAKYKDTLRKVKAQTPNAKLKKYADQGLKML